MKEDEKRVRNPLQALPFQFIGPLHRRKDMSFFFFPEKCQHHIKGPTSKLNRLIKLWPFVSKCQNASDGLNKTSPIKADCHCSQYKLSFKTNLSNRD